MVGGTTADGGDGPALDLHGLRRRVLLTGVLCLALFLAIAYTIAALELDDAWLLLALGLIYLLVARPLLRPAREALQLRRRVAYQAYLDSRQESP